MKKPVLDIRKRFRYGRYEFEPSAFSAAPDGSKLLSGIVYGVPKWLIAQLNTHALGLARNTESSRSKRVTSVHRQVRDNPFLIEDWKMAAGRGMQPAGPAPEWYAGIADQVEDWAIDACLTAAGVQGALGLAKEQVNRKLEPWMKVNWVFTLAENGAANFYQLRCKSKSGGAQDLTAQIAEGMLAMWHLTPVKSLQHGDWHLPFLTEAEEKDIPKLVPFPDLSDVAEPGQRFAIDAEPDCAGYLYSAAPILQFDSVMEEASSGKYDVLVQNAYSALSISAARAARASNGYSYRTKSIEEDWRLFADLVRDGHMSPLNHQAQAFNHRGRGNYFAGRFGPAWIPLRKYFYSDCHHRIPDLWPELVDGIEVLD